MTFSVLGTGLAYLYSKKNKEVKMKRFIVVMLMLIAIVAWFIVRTTEKVNDKKENTELVSPMKSEGIIKHT